MMSRNQPRPTKEEAQRNKIIKANGCMLTWLKFGEKKYAEIHHITMPGKRLGHAYTIPLSPWYHRGTCDPGKTKDEMRAKYGASLADGTRAFIASHHYTELELWQKLQVVMGLDDSLPKSKIVPRRLHDIAATDGCLVGVSTGAADLPQAQSCGSGSAVPSDARDAPEGRGDAGQVS